MSTFEYGSWLWQQAYEHVGHLCNGQCPDYEPGEPESLGRRDPQCFYCCVMTYIEQRQIVERAQLASRGYETERWLAQ